METRFHEKLTVAALAAAFGLSRWHFEALFRKETSLTFKARLIQVRLREASRLLQNTPLSIKEIGFSVGYRHAPNFSRDFKRCFGESPSQYRRRPCPIAKSTKSHVLLTDLC
ncbi:MAG: helix-turn-helix transcriptional regulator [Terriglobia bacterium]